MPDIYKQTTMDEVILTALAVLVIIVVLGALYTFFRAIFFFIFGGGKEENKKKGWNSIRFMIIGILLMGVVLVALPYILKSVSMEVSSSYNVKAVFSKVGELVKKTFQLGDVIKESQKENEFRGQLYYDINTPDTTTQDKSDYSL